MAHRILWNPAKFVDERTKKDFGRDGYWFSLWGSIIIALTSVLVSFVVSSKAGYSLFSSVPAGISKVIATFLVAFSLYYMFNIVSAVLTREIVGLLKKSISFPKALAAVAYSYFLLSVGIAVMVVFALFPVINLLTPLVGMISLARGYGIYIRFLHEYAGLSNVEAYIVSMILIIALVLGLMVGSNINLII